MSYTDLAKRLNEILDARRRISMSESGLVAKRGKEEEHGQLTRQAEEIRRKLKRIRYDTE